VKKIALEFTQEGARVEISDMPNHKCFSWRIIAREKRAIQ
jgi:hypothetical protein